MNGLLLSAETPAVSSIDAIIGATSTVTNMVGSVFNMITGNALLAVYASVGLLCVGITIFTRLKRVSR